MDMMRARLQAKPVAIQYPLGKEDTFRGIIDLIENKAIIFTMARMGSEFSVEEVPADYSEIVHEYREKIIEAASEVDEQLDGEVRRRRADLQRRADGRNSQGNDCHQADAGSLWFGFQEQRRSAVAGRGRGLSAVAGRYSSD